MINKVLEEAVIFLEELTKIYQIKTVLDLKGLNNRFMPRILDGEYTFAWNSEDLDHYHARKILAPYIKDIDDYEGFMLDKDILIPSLLKYGEKSLIKFSNKFFKNIEKTDFGYKIIWK